MQAHNMTKIMENRNGIVADIAAFKVSHSTRSDTTTLQAKRWSAQRSIRQWNVTHGFDSRQSSQSARQRIQRSSAFHRVMDASSVKYSKLQAHKSSGVVIDTAAFKVSHCIVFNFDATALQAKKRSA